MKSGNSSNDNDLVVDAFGGSVLDYQRLIDEFGIKHLNTVLAHIPENARHPYMSSFRDVMFGHIDLEPVAKAIIDKEPFGVMTGIKPSSAEYHIGSLITCSEVVYFQNMGGEVFFCIADLESYADGRTPLKEAEENAIENIADILALGLDLENAYIYRQSQEPLVQRFGFLFSSHVTYNMMRAIYGEKPFGMYMSALIQAGDILLPQLLRGPMPTVTPIGADQAPHARLTRDIAKKNIFRNKYGFKMPGFTFHRLIGGLDGSDKMAKRNPMSVLTLYEEPEMLRRKLLNTFTGGRTTVAEQQELGGRPEICRVFDLYRFFFMNDDSELQKICENCKAGSLMCGEDKKRLLALASDFIETHKKKRLTFLDKAREIVLERTS
ncbi:MAG: tryptophan--tRNA ligase [Candidatus Hodarchaeales archaeon]|jgi:tryptophanyl-tRNA synthetase